MHSQMNLLALRDEFGSDGNSFVVADGTEQEGGASRLGRAASDPKRCANIANKTQHGIKFSIAYQLGQPGIVQSPKGFLARALIRNGGSSVPLQQRNIPFDAGGKVLIGGRFCSAQETIGHVQIESRLGRPAAKNRRHVLNGVCGDSNTLKWNTDIRCLA